SAGELYSVIHRETARALSADNFTIALFDHGRDLARVVFHVEHGASRDVDTSYRGSDSEVVRSRKPVLIADDPAAVARLAHVDGRKRPCHSGVAAPMVHHGRVIGAVGAWSEKPGAYTEEDLALLGGIAAIAGRRSSRRSAEPSPASSTRRSCSARWPRPCSGCSTSTASPCGCVKAGTAGPARSPTPRARSRSRSAPAGTSTRISWRR